MTTLYLVRHGETAATGIFYGQLDVPLSERGRAQAQAAAGALEPVSLRAVYSSDLQRAADGAAMLARPRGLQEVRLPAFREMSLGVLEGVRWADVKEQFPALAGRRYRDTCDFAFPEGETMRAVQARVAAALAEVLARHPGEAVALVAHNSVNRVILGAALGLPLEGVFDFAQDFGCVNRLEYGSRPKVEVLNWTPFAPCPHPAPEQGLGKRE